MTAPSFILSLTATALLILTSCSHRIGYKLSEEDRYSGYASPKTLRVATFTDNAPKDQDISIKVGRDAWRINGREGYQKDETLAQGVSRAIADHLDHSGMFRSATYTTTNDAWADYELQGTIHDYAAMGKVRRGAEAAVIIGTTLANVSGALLTSAATSTVKTDIQTSVELRDLKLIDLKTNRIVWSRDRIARSKDYRAHFMKADAPALYKTADQHLREIINEIIADLGKSDIAPVGGAIAPEGIKPKTTKPHTGPKLHYRRATPAG